MEQLTKNENEGFYVLDLTDGDHIYNTTSKSCLICGCETLIKTTEKQYRLYYIEDNYVQDVWPTLSPGLREVIISGTHPKCWDTAFSYDDEEDYYFDQEG